LWRDGRAHTVNMHRVVAQAFLPNPNGLPVVMHLNSVRHDNRAANLKWGTQSENLAQAGAEGMLASRPSLTPEQVREIRAASGPSRVIADHHGVTRRTIDKIRRGETWRWIS
jgi:hypothetical protein